jgi:hypothetical protein
MNTRIHLAIVAALTIVSASSIASADCADGTLYNGKPVTAAPGTGVCGGEGDVWVCTPWSEWVEASAATPCYSELPILLLPLGCYTGWFADGETIGYAPTLSTICGQVTADSPNGQTYTCVNGEWSEPGGACGGTGYACAGNTECISGDCDWGVCR